MHAFQLMLRKFCLFTLLGGPSKHKFASNPARSQILCRVKLLPPHRLMRGNALFVIDLEAIVKVPFAVASPRRHASGNPTSLVTQSRIKNVDPRANLSFSPPHPGTEASSLQKLLAPGPEFDMP